MLGPDATAVAFARACESAGIKYVIVGGLAVAAWGQPRATADVDALVVLDRARNEAFVAALRKEGLELDERDVQDSMRDGSHVTVFDPRSSFHIDIKPARDAGERAQVDAGVELRIKSGPLRVARPEDTIAYKLAYGTPQDIADARSILVRQAGRLDMDRLRTLTRRLTVDARLEALLAEEEQGAGSP